MSSPSVLVIDDDHIARTVLEGILEPAGFAVTCAASGPEALELLDAGERPELVVCDIMMPGMHGLDVVRRVRAASEGSQVPWLFVTAFDDRSMRLDALAGGADALLAKPVDQDELLAHVHSLIDLHRRRSAAALEGTLRAALDVADVAVGVARGRDLVEANPALRGMLGIAPDASLPIVIPDSVGPYVQLHDGEGLDAPWSGLPRSSTYAMAQPGADTTYLRVEERPLTPTEPADGLRLLTSRMVTDEVHGHAVASVLVDAVRHEVRTPLTGIGASLDLLARVGLQAPYDEVLRIARRNALRLTESLTRLVEYGTLGRADLPEDLVVLTAADPRGLLAAHLPDPALLDGVDVRFDDAAGLVTARALLQVCLPELLANAWAAAGPDGTVAVVVAGRDGKVHLSVTDDGPGLPPTEAARAFAPFHQFDRSGNAPGVGLGLAMVRLVADQCGGTAQLTSRVGGPTVADVVLPGGDPWNR